ncbi:aspartate dehydrogenase domain-containing protein [Acrocarpospora catenulata]|uniref:aspartate dehydrogenase domain-containing protein n=1 Tax=Acrocarpospora catenulata TaxID=2836182 RepID=UPI001BDAB4F4|nr:aspartate dehydrogenase domain-containing protein [Acrocarpospora catenulata]
MRVSLLGTGGIGGTLRDLLAAGRVAGCVTGAAVGSRFPAGAVVAELTGSGDVVVEAAGGAAVRAYGARVLAAGRDLVVCSAGALADDAVHAALDAAALAGGARWTVPPGAIGGLDLLAAAIRADGAAEVTLTTVKTPGALGVAGAGIVFEGTAREAALRFPKTANVAVTLGLATTGIDRVRVVVTADPAARRTRHEIAARTAVGEYRFALVNDTLAASGGRTSAITVWSVVRALEELAARGRTPLPLKKGAPS